MILIDANILVYAAGAPHPHKAPSVHLLEQIANGDVVAAVDAEVLQELLHRYRAIDRWEEGKRVFDLTRRLFSEVLPITVVTLDRARRLLDTDPTIMARDALHAAVVLEERLESICSYDRDFDRISGIVRIEPASAL
jgi:predicted nucleic acid-binding protein